MPKRSRTPSLPSCYNTESGGGCDEPSCEDETNIPYVEHHDGRRFWGDRFYLNSFDDSSLKDHHQTCSCGSLEPPPTFPLVDFVNRSLKLKASVMGTFTIHPEWFHQTFPRFGARQEPNQDNIDDTSSIPTFVFHGHRGLQNALAKRVKHADEVEYDTDREEDDNIGGKTSSIGETSKFQYFLPTTNGATEAAKHFVDNPNISLCQVHCNWEKTPKSTTTRVSTGKENAQINHAATRETKFGVFHPKFFLLFEESGDLVVIVTTFNLTPTNSATVEGSWVQRFKRRKEKIDRKDHHPGNDFGLVLQDFLFKLSEAAAAAPAGSSPRSNNKKGGSQFPVEEFLQKHIGLTSLSEFSKLYHFETAKAYLVPVIPGDYEYNPNDSLAHDNKKIPRYYYGRQRVRYILEHLAMSIPKISKKTQDKSKSDRLVLQPTSLGTDWSRSQFAALIREYMGYYGERNNKPNQSNEAVSKRNKKQKKQHDYSYQRDDFWVCDQADIVWPTDKFMTQAANSVPEWMGSDGANLVSPLERAARKEGEVMNSFIFNSSKSFNACDIEFISRMAKYQPSKPCQVSGDNQTEANKSSSNKAPHFKSIARLFQNHVAMQKRDVPPADAYFSWFLMTSACLSLGAQGMAMANEESATNENNQDGDSKSPFASKVSYRNFELGVLFASHLPKKTKPQSKTKRSSIPSPDKTEEREDPKPVVYCFHPHRCSCSTASTTKPSPELVHLPVPYRLKPDSYFNKNGDDENDDDDDDESVMNDNPFFHEVSDGSRCIGNMLLTPFGQIQSNQTLDS